MPMNKGVEGSFSPAADVASDARAHIGASSGSEGSVRRRRRHHRRHQNLTRRSGRTMEIVFVTGVALAILFGVLYYLLAHDSSSSQHEESRAVPVPTAKRGAAPAHPS